MISKLKVGCKDEDNFWRLKELTPAKKHKELGMNPKILLGFHFLIGSEAHNLRGNVDLSDPKKYPLERPHRLAILAIKVYEGLLDKHSPFD